MTTTPARDAIHQDGDTGRCQHCQQVRPVFHHEGELQFWGYNPDDGAWLCAPDWSARETAINNDQPFHIDRGLIVWPEDEPKARYFPAPSSSGSPVGARENGGAQ